MSSSLDPKIIPIIRQKGTNNVPTFLKTKLFINFSLSDEFEFSFDELIRSIHNSPIYEKPEIGNNPFVSIEKSRPNKINDAVHQLMKIVVHDYENGDGCTLRSELINKITSSRIMLDIIINNAKDKGYIRPNNDPLYLNTKGKAYAIEHKLVEL